jgi:hypothetical protein
MLVLPSEMNAPVPSPPAPAPPSDDEFETECDDFEAYSARCDNEDEAPPSDDESSDEEEEEKEDPQTPIYLTMYYRITADTPQTVIDRLLNEGATITYRRSDDSE